MEGIHMLRDLLKNGDFLVKIDLKEAYLTVPIWKNHQKYLRFLWKDTMLEFACLPFGLATAPKVFTKLLKPVVGAFRQRGIRLIIYLDDTLIMAESHEYSITSCSLNPESPRGARLHSKLPDIITLTLPRDGISGGFDRFKRNDTPTSSRKVAKNLQKVSEIFRSNDNFCTRIVEIPGSPNLLRSGNIPCSYSLQASSKAKKYNFSLPSNLRSPGL
ncbi:Hypothetical predicted protein [Paramuricea clavata]|uniref:Uncharacterized protein n=1 Tax=Paramuricea clavata TaxID=317549 RepID=A0A6S7ISA1_PARCT|nr:Hypothetical predicted protein [Paramuricea clavata]